MLAYVYGADNKLKLQQKDIPGILEDGGAIIKVSACSVCGTDVRTYNFGSKRIEAGRTIGHEAVGVITEISSDIKGFSVGDNIALAPAVGCGECLSCKTGYTNMCDDLKTIGYQYEGGFAEYLFIPKQAFVMDNVNMIPEGDDLAQYSLAEPFACVINAHSYLNIQKGDDVVIFGAGYIGCMHAELAMLKGARTIIIIEPSKERRDEVGMLLSDVVLLDLDNTEKKVMKLTGGKGADVAIVACSVGRAQTTALNILAKRGRLSLFGGLAKESSGFLDSNVIHYKELSVFGVHASTPKQNLMAINLIKDKKIDVKKYITSTYRLEDIEKAFEDIGLGKVIKAVVTSK